MKTLATQYRYGIVPQVKNNPDSGPYHTFGIVGSWINQDGDYQLLIVDDVSTDPCEVWKIADKFNRENLSAINLRKNIQQIL